MNRWKHGKSITQEEREQAAEQVSDFRQWFETEVLEHDDSTKPSVIMVCYGL